MNKHLIVGFASIFIGMIGAVCISFLYTYLYKHFPENANRFDYIFGIGGGLLATAGIINIIILFVVGFDKKAKNIK